MMLVYRVECKKNRHGPYVFNLDMTEDKRKLRTALNVKHGTCINHPASYFEYRAALQEKGINHSTYRHGFVSLALLYGWFDGFVSDLIQSDYHVGIYDINEAHVEEYEHQCVFNSDRPSSTEYMELNLNKELNHAST